jgi:hypothetical protein
LKPGGAASDTTGGTVAAANGSASAPISPARRRQVIDALRRGTVPQTGLDLFAVGLDRFTAALDDELATVARGGSQFRAVRGEYGSGKRPSSPAGSPSAPNGPAWRPPRSRSPRPKPRCTASKPFIAG